jgi:hypothetical protein
MIYFRQLPVTLVGYFLHFENSILSAAFSAQIGFVFILRRLITVKPKELIGAEFAIQRKLCQKAPIHA